MHQDLEIESYQTVCKLTMSHHDLGADVEGCPHLTHQVAVSKATRTRVAVMVVPGTCHQYAAIFALKKRQFLSYFFIKRISVWQSKPILNSTTEKSPYNEAAYKDFLIIRN